MNRTVALCLVIGLLMSLCACGDQLPSESDSSVVGAVSTTTTTTVQGGTSSVNAIVGGSSANGTGSFADTTDSTADAIESSGTTTAVVGDTNVPVGSTITVGDHFTITMPSSNGHPSMTTTTTAMAGVGATTTTTKKVTTTTTKKVTTTTTKKVTTTTKPPLLQGDLAGKSLSVGDRMYDFTVTDSSGNTLTLSKMLQQKEMVVLNFWYINCSFCIKEFPAMGEAYGAYKDRVEIVALNPYDSVANIRQFRANNASLTFPMASCPASWVQTFALRGFPTTVVIDREGIIRKMHVGALQKTSDWEALFQTYLAD